MSLGLMSSAAEYTRGSGLMVEIFPRWLQHRWADIGGFPPPRQEWNCESTANSGMQVGTARDAPVKAEVPRGAKAEGDSVRSELGLAKEAPEPGVRSEVKDAMQWPQQEHHERGHGQRAANGWPERCRRCKRQSAAKRKRVPAEECLHW